MLGRFLNTTKKFSQLNKYSFAVAVGDKLPQGVLTEFVERQNGNSGPEALEVPQIAQGKKLAIFAVPGAFTPTCSAYHLPGFLDNYEALKNAGVDEIWCLSVNDTFVMRAWAKDQNVEGKIRLFADGSALYTKELGQIFDLTQKGLGVRSQRYSMLVQDGVVKSLNVDAPGKFEVSSAENLLKQAQQLL